MLFDSDGVLVDSHLDGLRVGAGIPAPAVVISAEDVEFGKPHPEPYLTAARNLGVDISDCVVFEDSSSGAEAGRAAGATVVAVGSEEWPFVPACRVLSLNDVAISSADPDRLTVDLAGKQLDGFSTTG